MSREIKFRAWDGKIMITPTDVLGDMRDEFGMSLSGELFFFYSSSNGDYCPESLNIKRYPNYILMQFTGLKDKNGVEIYEGDIVSCWDDSATDRSWGLDKIHTGIIEYTPDCYSLKIPGELTVDTPACKHRENDVYLEHWSNAENIEVIGNIYQNPDAGSLCNVSGKSSPGCQ